MNSTTIQALGGAVSNYFFPFLVFFVVFSSSFSLSSVKMPPFWEFRQRRLAPSALRYDTAIGTHMYTHNARAVCVCVCSSQCLHIHISNIYIYIYIYIYI